MESKFAQLSSHLAEKIDLLKIRIEQIDTDIGAGTLEPGGLGETESGVHLADFGYEGTLLIERLPAGSLALLLLIVITWLVSNDPDRTKRGLAWPSVEVIPLGSDLLDVVIEIRFIDAFYGSVCEGGPLQLGDVSYAPDGYVLQVAESGVVDGAPTEVAP